MKAYEKPTLVRRQNLARIAGDGNGPVVTSPGVER
jgi:hypothetical protein